MNEEEKKEFTKHLLDIENNLNAIYEDLNYLMEKYEL